MPVVMETDGAIVDGHLYVFGGYDEDVIKIFKCKIGKEWTELNLLPKPLSLHEVVQYGKYIILVSDFILRISELSNTENEE